MKRLSAFALLISLSGISWGQVGLLLAPGQIVGNPTASPAVGQPMSCGTVNEQTGSYVVQQSDNCNVVVINDHFSVAGVTLPATPAPPFKVTIVNQSSSFPLGVNPTSGSIIYYGTTQASLWMPANTSCDLTSDGTNFETSACTTLANPTGVANPLTIANTDADTVLKYSFSGFNSTAGSPNVSFGVDIGGNMAGATIVMTGCGQLVGTQPITVSNGGSGYATGDTITMVPSTGGSDDGTHHLILTVTWQISGVIQAISATNARAGVEVTGNGGNILTWPTSGTFVQSATSGSGTGLVVNMTESALPLATTIQSGFAGGSTIPLNANCSQTLTNSTQMIAWGHDDGPGIAAAIATHASTVLLPANHTYGIREPLSLLTSQAQDLDCQGSTIVALGPMAEMFNLATNGSIFQTQLRNGTVRNCNLEGMGVATLNILNGANWMNFQNDAIRDATQANIEVAVNGGGGTVVLNNNYDFQINNEPLTVPNLPIYCVWMESSNATDNMFLPGEIWNSCQQAGVLDGTFSTFYTGIHIYGVTNGPDFLMNGGAYTMTGIYADNPEGSYCGIQLNGQNSTVAGWKVFVSGTFNLMNQSGICNGSASAGNTITTGNWSAPTALTANGCVLKTSGTGATTTVVANNAGCQASNPLTPAILGFNTVSALTGSGTAQFCSFGTAACQTSSSGAGILVPIGGALQNLWVNAVGDIGNGNTYTIALSTSSGSPTITCTMTGTGSGNDSCNDLLASTGHSFGVTAGETIQLHVTPSASATGVRLYGGIELITFH